ncbi:putative aryl-alcohol dehydrogenase Aad16p [Monosporozyma unispora]|nr:hypothetical protein C6P44_003234 [Kazachstania unispora]
MSLVKQVPFGTTGMKVSPIIIGCMSYGDSNWANWCVDDEAKVFEILKFCYDNGLRTFDTADVYSNGKSERLLGKFLKKYNINRETVVIMTKVYCPIDEDMAPQEPLTVYMEDNLASLGGVQLTNQRGLARKHIIAGVRNSMERLGTYIDVLQIHRLDRDLPMKDIMKTLNWVVEQGYARYIGASTMLGSELVELQMLADKYEWFQFANTQIQYNLLYRKEEREVIPFANKHGMAVTPWSPNAGGKLTRPFKDMTATTRGKMTKFALPVDDAAEEIINRVEEIAKKHDVPMANISTAWVISKGCIPIVGMNSLTRVKEAVEATTFHLTEDEIKYLEEPYKPREWRLF